MANKLNFKFNAKKAQAYETRTLGASQIKDRRKIWFKFTAQTAPQNVKFTP